MPTGASGISGHGYNPSVQFPRSREIGGGWSLSGMFAQFWFAGQKSNAISEAALSWSGQSVPTPICSVEYVGDYPNHHAPSQFINTGGAYRLTGAQQAIFTQASD
jgi:hypothetical protein